MSIFVKSPSPEELVKFKKYLNAWSVKKSGSLESKLGDKIAIEESKSCEVYSASIETLVEDRSTEILTQPSKKNQLGLSPTVAHGSVNIWNKPSPTQLSTAFREMTHKEEIAGTEFYSGCKTCNENGFTDCPTCQKTGKLNCGKCHGQKRHDCPSCNGYGYLDCTSCEKGFIEVSCSACDRGKSACDGCGGNGYRSLGLGKTVDCHLCNSTGKRTCSICGGTDSESMRCNKCSNGDIPCGTCRTQKIVTCQNCDSNGLVPCSKCIGKSVLGCNPCSSQGGFRIFENLVYKTAIEINEITISPLKKITDKIRLSFQDQITLTQPHIQLEDIKNKISQSEIMNPVEEMHLHVVQNRPTTTVLEKFDLKKATVLDVSFKYEDQAGHAYFDPLSGLLLVDLNPLENKVADSLQKLKLAYQDAKAKFDFTDARALAQQAHQLKFSDLANKWNSEIDNLENQRHKKEAEHFLKKFKAPVLYGFGPFVWTLAGFATPISFSMLIIFILLGHSQYKEKGPKLEEGKLKHQKHLISQAKKLGLIYAIVILVMILFQFWNSQKTSTKAFKNGAPLTGVAK